MISLFCIMPSPSDAFLFTGNHSPRHEELVNKLQLNCIFGGLLGSSGSWLPTLACIIGCP